MASINLNNWRESPTNRYSFQHVDELIPAKHIDRSSSPCKLESGSPLVDNIRIQVSEQKALSIDELLAATATDGFLCLHHGKVIFERYANDNTPNSKHIIFSMTKSITGLVAGALIAQDRIAVDDTVKKHLPELSKSDFADVTLRHLLDMQSGIIYADTEPEYRAASGWAPSQSKTNLLDFCSTFQSPDIVDPGTSFVYSSINTDCLGLVLERVTGKSMADLIHEHVWQPIGAETDAFITVDSAGNARAAGGLCCSVRDMARVGQAIIDGKVASKAWVHDILHGGDKEIFAESAWGPSFGTVSTDLTYRSFWTIDGPAKVLIAMGIHGQMCIVDMINEIVMVKTSSQAERSDLSAWRLAYRLFRSIQTTVVS